MRVTVLSDGACATPTSRRNVERLIRGLLARGVFPVAVMEGWDIDGMRPGRGSLSEAAARLKARWAALLPEIILTQDLPSAVLAVLTAAPHVPVIHREHGSAGRVHGLRRCPADERREALRAVGSAPQLAAVTGADDRSLVAWRSAVHARCRTDVLNVTDGDWLAMCRSLAVRHRRPVRVFHIELRPQSQARIRLLALAGKLLVEKCPVAPDEIFWTRQLHRHLAHRKSGRLHVPSAVADSRRNRLRLSYAGGLSLAQLRALAGQPWALLPSFVQSLGALAELHDLLAEIAGARGGQVPVEESRPLATFADWVDERRRCLGVDFARGADPALRDLGPTALRLSYGVFNLDHVLARTDGTTALIDFGGHIGMRPVAADVAWMLREELRWPVGAQRRWSAAGWADYMEATLRAAHRVLAPPGCDADTFTRGGFVCALEWMTRNEQKFAREARLGWFLDEGAKAWLRRQTRLRVLIVARTCGRGAATPARRASS